MTSRCVALPVVESGDHLQTPRRDIYDVLCITNNLFGHLYPVDAQKLSAESCGYGTIFGWCATWLTCLQCRQQPLVARLEKGFDALCVSTFTSILHALVNEDFIVLGATTSRGLDGNLLRLVMLR